MAFTHQMTENGALLRTTVNGEIQGECCCGGNPCGSTGCTSYGVAVQCPSMELTVFDADYAGGNITWCGLTWTQAEVQAGATKTACPTAYKRDHATSVPGFPPGTNNYATLNWQYGTPAQLNIYRQYNRLDIGGTCNNASAGNLVILIAGTQNPRDQNNFQNCTLTLVTTGPGAPVYQVGILTGQGPPTYSNVAATPTASFFGSFTTAGGVQYSWARGDGW